MTGWAALPPLEFLSGADKEFYFLCLKITCRNTVEENPYAGIVAWKHEELFVWHAADLGRLGEGNSGIWYHKMKILSSPQPFPVLGYRIPLRGNSSHTERAHFPLSSGMALLALICRNEFTVVPVFKAGAS